MSDELDFSEGKILPPVRPPGWIGASAWSFIAWSGLLLVLLGAVCLAQALSLWVGGERATAVVYRKQSRVWVPDDYRIRASQVVTVVRYRFDDADRVVTGSITVVGDSARWAEGGSFEVAYWASSPTDAVPTADLFSPWENPSIIYAILLMVCGGLSATVAFRARTGSTSLPVEAKAVAEVAPLQSDLNIHFEPKECPSCKSLFAVRYSLYQNARLHPLYGVCLTLGVVLTLAAVGLAFWLGTMVVRFLPNGMALQQSERGLLVLVLLTPWIIPVWYLTHAWFRRVQALPRSFLIQCEKCKWSGPCRVVGTHS